MLRFIIAAVFLLTIFPCQSKERSNVLFISVDDWNDWVGANGGNQAKTPNLDKLIARGVTFRNAHASAVYCAPSRTSLMTGLNPTSTGCYHDQPHFAPGNDPELKDLAWWFRDNGYHTAGGGKLYHHMPGFIDMRAWSEFFHWSEHGKKKGWHLDSWGEGAPLPAELPSSGIAKFLLAQEKKRSPDKTPKKLNSHMEWAVLPDKDEPKMADTICTEWAADFLKTYDGEKPFFLGFGLYAPHKPNFVPQKYFKMNPLAGIAQPKMHPGDLDDLPPALRKKMLSRKNRIDSPLRKLKEGKKAVRGYLAALSYADAMVGRVLDALAESPYAENTVIVLWSDNGYHLGEKGCWAKHTLWERTSNVPFIWAGKGIAKGKVVDTTVSLLDTYPTLLELCGLPKNSGNEGHSLAGILADPSSAKDRTVLQVDGPEQFALINQEWRYVRTTGGEEQLYHVKSDPEEHTNLAEKAEHREGIVAFAKQLPKSPHAAGPRPPQLNLRIKGDEFEWLPGPRRKGKGKK
ncbi:MAG: sulfatase [Akkermansiaceae bacterium]|nr:sulfatase [Akkermansiaceae bacterium]